MYGHFQPVNFYIIHLPLKTNSGYNFNKKPIAKAVGFLFEQITLTLFMFDQIVCFIRAEAALRGVGAVGDAQTWFTNGITASMQMAGVSAANIATYLAANGTLSGTSANQIRQVIEEKYIANYGVSMEPWTDYRRTGFPTLTVPNNAVETIIPRSLLYPQTEIDLNPNGPGQKASQQVRVFWDTP
jgi:hypothetical protein